MLGGLFQGIGGAGYKNAYVGAVTAGASVGLSKFIKGASPGTFSASARLASKFFDKASAVAGALYDTAMITISALADAAAPSEEKCKQ